MYDVKTMDSANAAAARLMKRSVEVRDYIDIKREKAAQSIGVDQEWVRSRLVRIIEYGMREESVAFYEGAGKKKRKVMRMRQVDPMNARKALEFLGGDVGLGKGAGTGDIIPQNKNTQITAVFVGLPGR